MTEAQLQRAVIDAAKTLGWEVYHTRDSRGSDEGQPDLEMIHPRWNEFFKVELKSETGKLTRTKAIKTGRGWRWKRGQHEYMEMLRRAQVRVYLWRPIDWTNGRIVRILKGDAYIDDLWRPEVEQTPINKAQKRGTVNPLKKGS